jgi:5-methylcytosine-specific restriction endonuclease McrA
MRRLYALERRGREEPHAWPDHAGIGTLVTMAAMVYNSGAWQQLRGHWRTVIAWGGRPSCLRCGKSIEPLDSWELDHRVPLAEGGRPYDAAPSHSRCNARHGGQTSQAKIQRDRQRLAELERQAGQPTAALYTPSRVW